MKEKICALMGVLGGMTASLFGPWTSDLTALTVFMAVDFLSGVAVALVFHKSKKTPTGAYSSACGFAGLAKKAMLLALVAVGHQMDVVLGVNYIRTALCVAFLTNEGMSILENAGLMGIPIPAVAKNALDILHEKEETYGDH
ncbi:MAG: phage holin family protein [Ruminococcaceae bacterium]|nr:phage holin family protein [Oscillospiraceae bacterium]